MKMVGHKTESVYRRYAIVDEAMLQEGAQKLEALHAAQRLPRNPTILGRSVTLRDESGASLRSRGGSGLG
jgi:hypothetical protein